MLKDNLPKKISLGTIKNSMDGVKARLTKKKARWAKAKTIKMTYGLSNFKINDFFSL